MLVGLLTSELEQRPAFSSLRAWKAASDNGKEWTRLMALGYSGGAVPELHRSSLFAGRQACRPATNTLLKTISDPMGGAKPVAP